MALRSCVVWGIPTKGLQHGAPRLRLLLLSSLVEISLGAVAGAVSGTSPQSCMHVTREKPNKYTRNSHICSPACSVVDALFELNLPMRVCLFCLSGCLTCKLDAIDNNQGAGSPRRIRRRNLGKECSENCCFACTCG